MPASACPALQFHQNRSSLKGRSAGQRHTDRQTRLKIRALQVCNRANKQRWLNILLGRGNNIMKLDSCTIRYATFFMCVFCHLVITGTRENSTMCLEIPGDQWKISGLQNKVGCSQWLCQPLVLSLAYWLFLPVFSRIVKIITQPYVWMDTVETCSVTYWSLSPNQIQTQNQFVTCQSVQAKKNGIGGTRGDCYAV